MKNFIGSSLIAIGLLTAGVASAQTMSPTGTYTWTGPISVQKPSSPAFPCVLSVSIASTASGSELTGMTFSNIIPGLPCPAIDTTSSNTYPIPLTWDATNRIFTVPNLYIVTPTPGDCEGPISVSLSANPNPSMTINQVIPWVTAPGDCTVVSASPLPLVSPGSGSVN